MKKSKLLLGILPGIATLILIVVNHFLYAGHISTLWYSLFILLYYATWHAIKRYGKKGGILFGLICIAALLAYFHLLPKYTFRQAVLELSRIYGDETLKYTPNMRHQNFAIASDEDRDTYYCYVVDADEKFYYFDQNTGEHGIITLQISYS